MHLSLEIIMRTVLTFLWLWVYTNWIGRRLVAHNSSHLFVLAALQGTIGGNMAFNIKIELGYFLLSLFVMSGIGYLLMIMSLKSKRASIMITGEPVVIIKNGIILEENMKQCKFSLDAVKQGLRSKDIFNIEEVEQAVLETNGALSVLKKPDYRYVTLKDVKSLFPDKNSPN